jgi:hypothetical protein
METVFLAVVLVCLSVLGLGAGAIMGREPIKGSCGGLACVKGMGCAACATRGQGMQDDE